MNDRIKTAPAPTIRPLPGYLFARMEPESCERRGGIFIPLSANSRRRSGSFGVVVQVNETEGSIRGLLGCRCVFATWTGREFEHNKEKLTRYRLSRSDVLAVLDDVNITEDAGEVTVCGDGLPRCPRCRSEGQGNLLLDGDGYCIRCRRNRAGDIEPQYHYQTADGNTVTTRKPVTVSDEEAEVMSPSPKRAAGRVGLTGGWKR